MQLAAAARDEARPNTNSRSVCRHSRRMCRGCDWSTAAAAERAAADGAAGARRGGRRGRGAERHRGAGLGSRRPNNTTFSRLIMAKGKQRAVYCTDYHNLVPVLVDSEYGLYSGSPRMSDRSARYHTHVMMCVAPGCLSRTWATQTHPSYSPVHRSATSCARAAAQVGPTRWGGGGGHQTFSIMFCSSLDRTAPCLLARLCNFL